MTQERTSATGGLRTVILLHLVLLASAGSRALGQDAGTSMAVGASLRLTVGPGTGSTDDRTMRVIGTLVRSTPDSLVVTDSSGGVHSFSWGEIRSFEEKRSRTRGAGAIRGLKWGALLGGAGGAVLGAITGASCDPDRAILLCPGPWGGAAILGGLFGGIGAGVGAGVGAVSPGDQWVETSKPGADISARLVGGRRAQFAATWHF